MASSPLHASFPDSKTPTRDGISSVHLHASSASHRQTRRLQLRNAGFRGAAVPTRKVTPSSLPSLSTALPTFSGTSSGTVGHERAQSPDAENRSPSGRRARGSMGLGGQSSGVLQENSQAGNSIGTLRQQQRARPRVTSNKFWSPSNEGSFAEPPDSPPPSRIHLSNPKSRSQRTRVAKMSGKTRRSVSGETRKYVDHLEAELSSAQAQLQAMNSPSVTREQSSTLRHLKADLKHTQEEVEAWESKYEERIQEEVSKYRQVEATLRLRVRVLEDEADEAKYRVQELELQLEDMKRTAKAAETANVHLEKRLEIMSDLLAASPTKLDLHTQTPGGRTRQGRPKSLIPRFPTAAPWMASPERGPNTTSASPTLSQPPPGSPNLLVSPLNLTFSPDVRSSDDDSNQCEASGRAGGNMYPQHFRTKPTRRMRRFGAGSMGPKPLILPSTSHCDQARPADPVYEGGEYEFDCPSPCDDRPEGNGSPRVQSRRVSCRSNGRSTMQLAESPLPNLPGLGDSDVHMNDEHLDTLRRHSLASRNIHSSTEDDPLLHGTFDEGSPLSGCSGTTPRNSDSGGIVRGTPVGRNLMDELRSCSLDQPSHLFEGSETAATILHPSSSPFMSGADDSGRPLTPPHSDAVGSDAQPAPARYVSGAPTAVASQSVHRPLNAHRSPSCKTVGVQSNCSISTLDSFGEFLGDFFASPIALAKFLVEKAYARLRVSLPSNKIQWWLVGALLRPMTNWTMLAGLRSRDENEQLLQDTPDGLEPESGLDYVQSYRTPPPSDALQADFRGRNLVAGRGKKRTPSISRSDSGQATPCAHLISRHKHSPLLWLKFSMTLAIAVGIAFKDGPSSLLQDAMCDCKRSLSGTLRRRGRDAIESL